MAAEMWGSSASAAATRSFAPRRAEVEAGAPVEPVGAGAEALPAVPTVELVQVAQQS